MGTVFKYRLFPGQQAEMTWNHGRWTPTAELAAESARMFYGVGVACLVVSVVWFIVNRIRKTWNT